MAQQRCATVEYQKMINPEYSKTQTKFENWINNQQVAPKIKTFDTQGTNAATYVIPVVVHVIHNGEPIGTGTNISDAQIISQINVLNKDFKRLNADASQTPSEFLPVAGSLDIEFVLAKQDPEGLTTNGIQRVQGTQSSWTLAENAEFKALSYWPSEDYMNIWVINFIDPSNFIGYAQFPESSLPGLENSSSDPLTDGIVINYKDIGSIDDGAFDLDPQFNKGRTATHEIGHFFGLRHIWGDVSGCGGTDYVSDTPSQSSETSGCPSHPQVSCSSNKMFQNYLDYTNDACMNLFTAGQVTRMEIILQNSPRRASLTTSPRSQDPAPVPNDLGIRTIVTPEVTSCGGTITPTIEVRNYGTNTVTSTKIQFLLNGISQETKDFAVNLTNLQTTELAFNPINLTSPSSSQVSFIILQTNGTTDGNAANNTLNHTTEVPVVADVPYFEFFDTSPPDWTIQNPDARTTWQNVAALNGTAGNRAMYINFYDYEEKGVADRLLTPVLNLNGATAAILRFDRAYAKFPSASYEDALKIVVISNCSSDLLSGVEIFNKAGDDLATADQTFNAFIPSGASQWETESISLNSFIGSGNIQLAFIGQNANGNNLYLDNVFVLTGDLTDIALKEIISPSPVVSKTTISPVIRIKNEGSIPINSVEIEIRVNGTLASTKNLSSLSLLTGSDLIVDLDGITLSPGSNQLSITISKANGATDEAPSNNTMERTVVVNSSFESIPSRQDFSVSFQDTWTIVSQSTSFNWEITSTNKGTSLVYRGFTNTNKGDDAWLVSPVLDFSKSVEASLFFDISYAVSFKGTERLQVLSSTDGGDSFGEIQFDQTGNQFSVGSSTEAWIPSTDNDWNRQYVNLNDLVGESSVRLAFVVTNDNGNNIYLDDIELFNDDNPSPAKASDLYSVYTPTTSEIKVTFTLPIKETSRLQVYNVMGQMVLDNVLPDNLNQTYTIDMSNQRSGIYIVRVQVADRLEATRVFISN
ncbi:MAG: M43 family zinc metalloprotease [Cyclobacteriaceae bacterium]